MKPKFWMVWRDGGGSPRYQHDSEESARVEAERLARAHGGTFHVLECTASCTRNDVEWQEHSQLTKIRDLVAVGMCFGYDTGR